MRLFLIATLVVLATLLAISAASAQPSQVRGRATRVENVVPNPFNPTLGSTEISFELGVATDVEVRVFSIAGVLVTPLLRDVLTAGRHRVYWDGRAEDGSLVPNGTYLCQVKYGERVISARIIVTR